MSGRAARGDFSNLPKARAKYFSEQKLIASSMDGWTNGRMDHQHRLFPWGELCCGSFFAFRLKSIHIVARARHPTIHLFECTTS